MINLFMMSENAYYLTQIPRIYQIVPYLAMVQGKKTYVRDPQSRILTNFDRLWNQWYDGWMWATSFVWDGWTRSTVLHFLHETIQMREWSATGASERDACYKPIIHTVLHHFCMKQFRYVSGVQRVHLNGKHVITNHTYNFTSFFAWNNSDAWVERNGCIWTGSML